MTPPPKTVLPSSVLTLVSSKTSAGRLEANFLVRLARAFGLEVFIELTGGGFEAAAKSGVFGEVYSAEQAGTELSRLSRPTLARLTACSRGGDPDASSWVEAIVTIGTALPPGSVLLLDDLRSFPATETGADVPEPFRTAPRLHRVYAALAQAGWQMWVLGDVAVIAPATSEVTVSPLIQALTVSRVYDGTNLEVEEVFSAEEVITQAQGEERDAVAKLGQNNAEVMALGVGLHFKFWRALVLLGAGRIAEFGQQLSAVVQQGFTHWRLRWYFVKFFLGSGELATAADSLRELLSRAPQFAPAQQILDEICHDGLGAPSTEPSALPASIKAKRPSIAARLRPGDLVFDVGANVGAKAQEYLEQGARVVCVEPQPNCVTKLRARFAAASDLVIVPAGLAAERGQMELSICSEADTISTFAEHWKKGRFARYTWDQKVTVPVTTLDALIAEYGVPRYCKIDVEGFEFQVLQGLRQPLPHLSFEFAIEYIDDAKKCVRYLESIGFKSFNAAFGEDPGLAFVEGVTATQLFDELRKRPEKDLWGDIYAESVEGGGTGESQAKRIVGKEAGVVSAAAVGTPVVTIFMPAYNREKYIGETLDSLQAQTFTAFELIVADDGSTDATLQLVRERAAKDPRIRVIELAHAGEVAARNAALRAASASTRYFLNHDSDDISLPNKLGKLVGFLDANPSVAIVGCLAEYFDDAGRNRGRPPIECEPARIRATFGEVNSMINSAALIRREVVEKIGAYREEFRSVDDYDFFARALMAGFELANVPEVLHRIRLHPDSVSSTRASLQADRAKQVKANYRAATIPSSHGAATRASRPSQSDGRLSILHTVEFYAPHTGGAEIVVQQISERLARRGHHVTVATTRMPERGFRELNGVTIQGFDVRGKLADGIHGDARSYQQFLREARVDVVMNYAAQVWTSDLAFRALFDGPKSRACVLAPCGYSALVDERTLRWPHYREYFEKVLPAVLPRYDAVVYHSGIYKDYLFGKGLGLSNGIIIPNGTDEDEFTKPVAVDFRKKYGITTPLMGLCVANFYQGKGQERLIECVRQMKRSDFTLVLVGKEGTELPALRERAAGLPVQFVIAPPRQDTVAAFRSADLFLFGSHIEASPLVIIEAKAAKLPYVSTDCGNVREWKGGVVCSPAEMAVAATRLLNDAAERRRLGAEGWQEWKARLTWEAVTDQWEELYRRVDRECAARVPTHNPPSQRIVTDEPAAATSATAGAGVVVAKLQGGLGNQMFQYAAGLALARRHGAKLMLDQEFLLDRTPRPNFTFRDYDLDLFSLPEEVVAVPAIAAQTKNHLSVFKERGFHHDPRVNSLNAGTYLDGFWQSPKYFAGIEDEIRSTFTRFRAPLSAQQEKLRDEIRSCASVCLHVRRGDYVSNPAANSFHGVCTESYFRNAVRSIRTRIAQPHFYIFSDDIEWCRGANLVDGADCTLVSHDYDGERYSGKLQLMIACRHFIIPNSTFAWWAAFLGQTNESVVIAPTPWFNELATEFADLLPASWLQLSRNPGPLVEDVGKDPAVSVVVPCYKQAHFLQEAVESVVAQTYADWELLVVNDGSPDNTSEVARQIIAKHPDRRIRLIEKPNGGLADARNAGIREARGRYILPLDSDDRIDPRMLEKTVAVLESSPDVAIAYTDQQYFGAETKPIQVAEYDFRRLCGANFFAYCSLYRREAWAAAGGYNRNMVWGYEDWDFWIGCGERGFFGRRIPEKLFYYRVKADSMLTSARKHDDELKSQIVLNHPKHYDPASRDWAAKIGGTAAAAKPQSPVSPVANVSAAPATLAAATPAPATVGARVVALMSAYNEGDVIYHVIGDLIANGVEVYLIDNSSTDNTASEAAKWLGKGLLKIERFPGETAGYSERCSKEYVWKEILRRKEELATQLGADWYLHVDADEFRESPWPGKTLAEAIRQVDLLGYNAINFELLNFRPTDDSFVPGADVRIALPLYQPGEIFDAMQVKAWKSAGVRPQLVNNGGHSIGIPERRVFPLNFILRHYPIRGETHGRRKVFQDRLPRFAKEEVAHNWHVQYNEFVDGRAQFLHDPAKLVRYDGDGVRAALLARFSHDLLLNHTLSGATAVTKAPVAEAVRAWIGRRLSLGEPLAAEVATQAEQLLGNLLRSLLKQKEDPVLQFQPGIAQLLLAMLDAQLAIARLSAEAHYASVATRLQRILSRELTKSTADAVASSNGPGTELPLVSICIPTYNGADFIRETVACAMTQTYPNVEILISDDNSTDDTVKLAEAALASVKTPYRILRHDRLGLVGNWMHCAEQARGKYVKYLFQDDALDPDCVAELVAVAERAPDVALVFSPRRVETRGDRNDPHLRAALRDSSDVHRGWSQLKPLQPGIELLRDPKLLQNPINKVGEPTTVLLLKEAVLAVGGFDPQLRQLVDLELWLRLMTRYRVGFVDRALSTFRLHAKQATQQNLHGGLIAADWLRFFEKLAKDPAFSSLPESHRSHAEKMCAQISGRSAVQSPAASGPAAADPAAFQSLVTSAQDLVRDGRVEEGIAQMQEAERRAPNAECATRAREILAMLQASMSARPAEAAPSSGTEELFEPAEVKHIEQLLAAYQDNPADEALSTQLHELQVGLMKYLVTADVAALPEQFKGSFGQVFRLLARSGLASAPRPEGDGRLDVLDEALAASRKTTTFDFRPLLARMLFAPAHHGASTIDAERIPAWLLGDYVEYILRAPAVFVLPGEAGQYHAHVLAVCRWLRNRLKSAADHPITVKVAEQLALKANFIPLYFHDGNTREVSEVRGLAIDYVLRRNGARVDFKPAASPLAGRKIRVGFLNAHFGAQTETHITLPMLRLDPVRFEKHLFALGANPGPVQEYARSFADQFTLLPGQLAEQAKTIRDAQLDVLIVGTNITAVTNQVCLLAAHRLAPVQLAAYTSPVTTGLRHIDGYLTGSLTNVGGLAEHFSEKLRFCDGPPGCFDYTVEAAATTSFSRESLRIGSDETVFINAAACFKILPEMQDAWIRILKAVPNSRLMLLPFNPNWSSAFPVKQFERTLLEACARHGVDSGRLILTGSLRTRADVKALESIADVYLDTAPFSGSISVVDPLELGLPVVVQEGLTHRSRMAAALLRDIDVTELIVRNEAEYIALATKLGLDPTYRRQISTRITAGIANKPKFLDPDAYAEELGGLLEALVGGRKSKKVATVIA